MSNLRSIRYRIRSVKSTSQITKAMQMVAAAKMKKAQKKTQISRQYLQKFEDILGDVFAVRTQKFLHPFLKKVDNENEGKHLFLVVSTERGLCGSLNANLLRKSLEFFDENSQFSLIGSKLKTQLSRKGKIDSQWLLADSIKNEELEEIFDKISKQFLKGEYTKVSLVYTHFFNVLKQTPEIKPLLPIVPADFLSKKTEKDSNHLSELFLFEPHFSGVLDTLLPLYIKSLLRQAILESQSSEHSARMVAMKSATDNAHNLIDELTLEYNKLRQAAITQELLEIATAMSTLEQK